MLQIRGTTVFSGSISHLTILAPFDPYLEQALQLVAVTKRGASSTQKAGLYLST